MNTRETQINRQDTKYGLTGDMDDFQLSLRTIGEIDETATVLLLGILKEEEPIKRIAPEYIAPSFASFYYLV